MTDRSDRTVEELRDELRERDMKVSGTKDELLERLDDAEDDDDSHGDPATDDAGSGRAGLADVTQRIKREVGEVTGLTVEGVSGIERNDDNGWEAVVDVVEVSRVPRTMDVLASYAVRADADGAVVGYERLRRFRRAEAGA